MCIRDRHGSYKIQVSRSGQEWPTTEGDSPVYENFESPEGYLSRLGHVKPRLNLRSPFRKAKYSLMTDSKLSSVSERWKEPRLGEALNLKPYAYKRSEHYDSFSVTACLLHNDPASCRMRLG